MNYIFEYVFGKYMIKKPGEKDFFNMDSLTRFMKDMRLSVLVDEADFGLYFNKAFQI